MATLRKISFWLRLLATIALAIAFAMPQVQYPGFESPEYAFGEPIFWIWFLWPLVFLTIERIAKKPWLSVTLAVAALPAAWASRQAIALQVFMDGVGLVGRDLGIGAVTAVAVLYAIQLLIEVASLKEGASAGASRPLTNEADDDER